MENILLDARTINVVLKALNQPIDNSTQACAVVRSMALNGGLKASDDEDLSEGYFTPWMPRENMLSRALQAVSDYEDWCHNNESEWSGWGDQIIPLAATAGTIIAVAAKALLANDRNPDQLQFLLSVEKRQCAVIEKGGSEILKMAFDLSDKGLVALEQLPSGVDLHITRLGKRVLDLALNRKGENKDDLLSVDHRSGLEGEMTNTSTVFGEDFFKSLIALKPGNTEFILSGNGDDWFAAIGNKADHVSIGEAITYHEENVDFYVVGTSPTEVLLKLHAVLVKASADSGGV